MTNVKAAQITMAQAAQATDSITFKIECRGETVAVLPAPLRTFTSGNTGFGAYGKTMLPDGRRLQLSINAVVLK